MITWLKFCDLVACKVRKNYFKKHTLVIGTICQSVCKKNSINGVTKLQKTFNKYFFLPRTSYPLFSPLLHAVVFIMLSIRFRFFNEDTREHVISGNQHFTLVLLLFILLIFARSPWLPGVRKHHNFSLIFGPILPANQVSIAENSKKNRSPLRRNKLILRHSSKKLPRSSSLLDEIGDHVDLCGDYSSIN